jgi:hypothetical protein
MFAGTAASYSSSQIRQTIVPSGLCHSAHPRGSQPCFRATRSATQKDVANKYSTLLMESTISRHQPKRTGGIGSTPTDLAGVMLPVSSVGTRPDIPVFDETDLAPAWLAGYQPRFRAAMVNTGSRLRMKYSPCCESASGT